MGAKKKRRVQKRRRRIGVRVGPDEVGREDGRELMRWGGRMGG